MKRIMYSSPLKIVAIILLLFYVAIGTYFATDAAIQYQKEEFKIYHFEGSFEDSRHLRSLLSYTEGVVDGAYREYYGEYGDKIENITFEKHLAEKLDGLWCADKVYYFVSVNGTEFTNYNNDSSELSKMEFYSKSSVNEKGETVFDTSLDEYYGYIDSSTVMESGDNLTVICAVTPAYVDGARFAWERQEQLFFDKLSQIIFCTLISIPFFVYLICVAGKDKNGEKKSPWIDLIWTEVHLGALVGAVVLGAVLWTVLVCDGYYFSKRLLWIASISIAEISATIVLLSLLSLVRKIKHQSFLRTSVIFITCRAVGKLIVRVARWIYKKLKELKKALSKTLFKKTSAIFCTMLLIYTGAIGACGIFSVVSPLGIILAMGIFIAGCFFLAYRAADIDNIKLGAKRIEDGERGYKIEGIRCDDLRAVSSDINDIGKGMESAVTQRVKAERMKTELITNVSHDLKTPLTSIISYTELLSNTEGLSQEAMDYIAVISKKSLRLKKLTQDLFDISKAQSGNEEVVFEKLDVKVLVEQTLAEYEEEIKGADLTFCTELENELYVLADGRKLSRVMGNLMENIFKYTLSNTRVFISAKKTEDNVYIEFKNISSYPLDFDSNEILERFARGDVSRSTEGNGLGLAISKTYVELCKGTFEVIADGDLFKAILKLPIYNEIEKD